MTMVISGSDGVTFPDSTTQNTTDRYGFVNRIINGDMRIDQRNAGASVTVNDGNVRYTLDRWAGQGQATDGVFSVQQSSVVPSGFNNSLLVTVTTADSSLGATQIYRLLQRIEGFNVSDLGWGTANAQTVTLSFWVRSSVTGTFGGAVNNSSAARNYPFTFSISAANTFEYKTISIAGDTSGTWLTTNGVGLSLSFGLGVGSTFSGTPGSWSGSEFYSATGATNLMATNGATFYITGVQLEAGSVATPFERRPFGAELALCQRYYYMHAKYDTAQVNIGRGGYYSATQVECQVYFPVTMRTRPSLSATSGTNYYISYRNGANDNFNSFTIASPNINNAMIYNPSEASGTAGHSANIDTDNTNAFVAFSAEL